MESPLLDHFKGRKNLIEIVEAVTRTWKITNSGMQVSESELEEVIKIADITPELLQSDEWKNASSDLTMFLLKHRCLGLEEAILCKH